MRYHASMLEEVELNCPYCGEAIAVIVDLSGGDQSYVEDCAVCCQPIVLAVAVDDYGQLESITARPENG